MRKLSFAACAAIIALSAGTAQAAELVQNGGFDADLAGWTKEGSVSCSYTRQTGGPSPLTGGYARASAGAPSVCGFYQDVAIPAGATGTLSATIGSIANSATSLDFGRLQIRNPTTNAVLATPYSHNGTQGAPDPIANRGPFSIDAYAGQTIRIYFETGHQNGPYAHSFDNVSINATVAVAAVPTMSEWAMILFGTALAGGAVLYIQRRRQFS